MNKNTLINNIAKNHNLSRRDAKLAVDLIFQTITDSISSGQGAEIRGFGTFKRKHRSSYLGTDPRTSDKIMIIEKYLPAFKPGKNLRALVDNK